MPHIIVKIASGQTEQVKEKLAEKITHAVMETTGNPEAEISLAIEETAPKDWVEEVYKKLILPGWDKLYKKPGYDPLSY